MVIQQRLQLQEDPKYIKMYNRIGHILKEDIRG